MYTNHQIDKEKYTVGQRLAKARGDLKISQAEMATRGCVSKLTQGKYERDVTSPTAHYLRMIEPLGVDILWVLTERTGEWPEPEEQHLLSLWRQADLHTQQAIWRVLDSKPAAHAVLSTAVDKSESIPRQVFKGNVGNVIDRNEGAITQTFGKK